MKRTERNQASLSGTSITCPLQRGRFHDRPSSPERTLLSSQESSPRWFGRIPASVLLAPELHSDAVRILGILSLKTLQGNRSAFGMREIGRYIGKGRTIVRRRLLELVSHGDVIQHGGKNGQRAWYELTSPVFAGKGTTQEPEAPGSSRGQSRVKPSVVCPRCHMKRGGLLKTGWCRSCHTDIKLDRKIELKFIERDRAKRATA